MKFEVVSNIYRTVVISSGMPESTELSSLVFVDVGRTSDGRQERRQGSLILVLSFLRLLGMVPTLLGRENSLKKSLWKSSSASKILWQLFCRFFSWSCETTWNGWIKTENKVSQFIPGKLSWDACSSPAKGPCAGILFGRHPLPHYLMTWRNCSLSQNSWLLSPPDKSKVISSVLVVFTICQGVCYFLRWICSSPPRQP